MANSNHKARKIDPQKLLRHQRMIAKERGEHDYLYRAVLGGLKLAIHDHGPIDKHNIAAAVKLIEGQCFICRKPNDQPPIPVRICSGCIEEPA